MIKNRKVLLCGFFIPYESLILDYMKKSTLLLLFLFSAFFGFSQAIKMPNFAVASHPMIVERVQTTSTHIIFELSVENKSAIGNFCADKNIFIRDLSENKKIKLSFSEGIPICPEVYNFKSIGEKLKFQLYFPKPDHDLKYLDLIEDCNEACFSIHGIILDIKMNQMIEDAFSQFEKSDYEASENTLKKIISEYSDYPYGFLHLNLIQVLIVQGEDQEAKKYYQSIQQSKFSDKNFILDQLSKTELFSK
jgi:hypothetical protein